MTRQLALTAIAVLGLLVPCAQAENRYSNHHCNLTIDNSQHLDATLASAMDPNASGTFCLIGYTIHGGATHFTFANNRGNHSESIFNAIDDRLKSQEHLGLNGRIIVGYGNMDNPPTFYAYDGECPNCFDPNALPLRSYPLSLDGQGIGIATCAKCHRQYRLNQEGIVANNTGKPLGQYRATSTGAHGRLQVY